MNSRVKAGQVSNIIIIYIHKILVNQGICYGSIVPHHTVANHI
jgi:hypothetical protein